MTKRKEFTRRLQALEAHIQDLEERLSAIMYTHLTEFHPGQNANIPRDASGSPVDIHGGEGPLFSHDEISDSLYREGKTSFSD